MQMLRLRDFLDMKEQWMTNLLRAGLNTLRYGSERGRIYRGAGVTD